MKDQMLKIAKVKSEKEFYKKYPTEEAFMKAHGKAFKKAAMGAKMVETQLNQLTDFGNPPKAQVGKMVGGDNLNPKLNPVGFNELLTNAKAVNAGISAEQQQKQDDIAALEAKNNPPEQSDGGFGNMVSGIANQFLGEGGESGDIVDDLPIHKYGGELYKYQGGGGLTGLGNAIGGAFQKQGGLGSGLVDMFSGTKGTGKGMIEASQSMFKGVGLKGGLKTLGTSEGLKTAGKAAGVGLLNAAPQILQGIGQMKEQKANIKKADQTAQISGLTAQAAESQPQLQKRRYVRPEDALVQPGQLGNPQGAGTNYLAQNGKSIGGNPTEIQNTYNSPLDIYSDLGFTPLNDNNVKQYAYGGNLNKAEFGEYFQNSGQASIGKGVGSAVGSIFGPVGGMVGGFLGGVAGNALGGAKDARELQKYQNQNLANLDRSAWAQGAQNIQSTYSSFMEDGGWVSNEWQPQVIAKFGEHDVKDLLKPPYDADMLRSGGHLAQVGYTAPSAEAMFTGRPELKPLTMEYGGQMAMGGDLQVHRGKAETMSYNPYLPGDGETVMFRGPSHDNGGMPVSYGENGVEVEGGEPAVKLQDGGKDENLVVFGNMAIPKYGVAEIGDDKAKGKKFKNYIADLSKTEAKQNKIIDKSIKLVNSLKNDNPFDQLSMNASRANLLGANMKLKDIADKKQKAAVVQNAILDTAKEFGVESDGLAKGKLKPIKDPLIGKDGLKLKKAQSGVTWHPDWEDVSDYEEPQTLNNADLEMIKRGMSKPGFMGEGSNILPEVVVTGKRNSKLPKGEIIKRETNLMGLPPVNFTGKPLDLQMAKLDNKKKGKFDWETAIKTLASGLGDYFRPSTSNPLEGSQLMGEMYALGNNQVDPVYAQTYQPMLDNAYDISLQDQINSIDSQARAAIRAAGQDPSAQAYIMSQAADLKNKVLGEQMRINQANKAQVYQANRAAINDSVLKNIGILDTQQVRQSQAKSATKAQTIEALKSIGDKIAQNKLETRNINTMENLYNYRFGQNDRVYNANNPYFFNTPTVGSTNVDGLSEYEKAKAITNAYEKKAKGLGKEESRNGSIVKALKNI